MNNQEFTHTFAVCAYKESPFLEECIISLKKQIVPSTIIVCTSTPCTFIEELTTKYDLPLYVRDGKSDIRDDWNFAYNMAKSDYVTIAHQDDVYSSHYAEEMRKKITNPDEATIYLTDYLPLKSDMSTKKDLNVRIKRLLRFPLRFNCLARYSWIRRLTLSFGNSICCPSVTYNKKKLGASLFVSEFKFNIDWDTFMSLARKDGSFAYTDMPLTYYRIHDGATTKEFINDNRRLKEDTAMFKKIWPGWFARLLMIIYKEAYNTYNTYHD